ncbi:MAG: MFS transporter [Pseudomonadota bacterium]
MPIAAKIALLFVVFVDLLGQGLVFPIINALIMQPSSTLLPHDASSASRHLSYGLVIGIFFLSWFLGAPYVSKLSDVIGRKKAILICLFGALAGYAITILALHLDSLWMLILGRAITGFTAGNQPIAQAAMVDASTDDVDRARNMGYIITGVSIGMVGGPLLGGLLSDPLLIGQFASLALPFWASLILVIVGITLVIVFFEDVKPDTAGEKFVFRPTEIFELLWRITKKPLVMRITAVFLFFHITNVMFYVFVINYMSSRFGYGSLGGSMIMLTIGAALAFSSTFLVAPTQRRISKRAILIINFLVWAACSTIFVTSPYAWLCFVPVFVFYFVFGISYPTFLGIYSSSVSDAEQGWVMGMTIAVFTLIAGTSSLLGGELMGFDIGLPFYISIASALLGAALLQWIWRTPDVRAITGR